jgi:4'-phosphopantetheinyl transferase
MLFRATEEPLVGITFNRPSGVKMIERRLAPLLEGECQIWWANTVEPRPHLISLLNSEEQKKLSQFRREHDRSLYLVAHAIARIVLADYLDIEPQQIVFTTVCKHCGGPHGKPRICASSTPFELSISHSGEMAVVAFTRGIRVGVDIEHIGHRDDDSAIAELILSPSEHLVFAGLSRTEHNVFLRRYWTRKEAILKATGDGLLVPPNSLTVSSPLEPPQLTSCTYLPFLTELTYLNDLTLHTGYIGCLATLDKPLKVVEREAANILVESRTGSSPLRPRAHRH